MGGKMPDLSSNDNLQQLEVTLPARATRVAVRKPVDIVEKIPHSHDERKAMKLTGDLKKMDSIISEQRESEQLGASVSGSGKGVELPAWRTRVSKAERPPTPTVDIDPSDEMANCIVLIQRLLRGRAVQNAIFEGKERRKELIRELRAADEVGLESEMADVVAEKKDAIKEASADTVAERQCQ